MNNAKRRTRITLDEQAHQLRRDEISRLITLAMQYFAKSARNLFVRRRLSV
jgi:hypothetical protein